MPWSKQTSRFERREDYALHDGVEMVLESFEFSGGKLSLVVVRAAALGIEVALEDEALIVAVGEIDLVGLFVAHAGVAAIDFLIADSVDHNGLGLEVFSAGVLSKLEAACGVRRGRDEIAEDQTQQHGVFVEV